MLTHACWAKGAVAGVVLAIAAAGLLAAPPPAIPQDGHDLLRTPTTDVRDSMSLYLAPVRGQNGIEPDLLSALPSGQPGLLAAYNAPLLIGETAGQPPATATYASLVYPKVTGLAGAESDERSVPLSSTTHFALGPGGVGRVMLSRPGPLMESWDRAGETAISYIRPHVNLQMLFALEAPGKPQAGDFEGPGLTPRAYMTVDHQKKVDSLEIGTATEHFGNRSAPTPVDEPQTAVSAGLDLGLLPTFLSQMGVNVSIVATRGRDTGNISVALVGTTELPVDWAPRERPYMHPTAPGLPMGEGSPVWAGYFGGGGGIATTSGPGGGPGPQPTQLTEIAPVVPEPFTVALMWAGAVVLLARRRRS